MMAAARLVGRRAANHNERRIRRRGLAVDEALRTARLSRAANGVLAGCLQLREPVGVGRQERHRSERTAEEVQVEAGDDYMTASIGQLLCQVNDLRTEELRLVDTHHASLLPQ